MSNLIGIAGIVVILAIAFAFSSNRKAINLRIVGAAFALQVVIATLVLYWDKGRIGIEWLSNGVMAVIGFSRAGIDMVFGPLANADIVGFSFAINVLPIIIFFSALMSVLYHLRIMEWIVRLVGGFLHKVIGTGAVESMNAAANVFVGQTEAPLAVRPYLKGLTEAQMFTVMVSGLASIAGTVLAGYAMMGAELKYLLAAAFMAAPGGLLMAKIVMPDDEVVRAGEHEKLVMERSEHKNLILAAASGTTDGLRLAANIGAMLIAFVALIALFNGLVGWVGGWFGLEITLQSILGRIFQPLMYLLSVPWHEAQAAGALFGEKLILNEFVAFSHLNDYLAGMSDRTVAVVTFSLCGFANLSSIAILLGGLGVLVPEKRDLIGQLGIKAVFAGSLSNLMSAALAGLLLTF
ncbi:MAG: NupC/NupG family nucleoside CNT transporter [Gammaproteobacteria bacterium]|nr:NupC/NupG family nucleoside CNT transporter [Gammaproteobacteria bacterium]NNF49789.1 NupC/NupG family nucleoside CNT transporter [Woeseiaceae bacterium]MBT8094053.1 NupC/NupG family nucleoside CNT transporter [Gammaproteobacteria bacterium]MBT8105712.1 NupC/NupG family nucleoside CNT transporter [Gammaproteobacteria bacterium]NNK25726.1 NupC/NupG family nucleoside CNT transporter [Woeseiaceae bacterium]